MHQNHTISIHFAKAVLGHFADDTAAIEHYLGLSGINGPLFDNPRARISPHQLSELMKALFRQLDDEFMGLAKGALPSGSFFLLARNVLHSKNLFEVYKHTQQALKVMTAPFSLQLVMIKGHAHIRFTVQSADLPSRIILTELVLLVWHRFPSWLIGRKLPLVRVCLPFNQPQHAVEYPLLFGTKMDYNCEFAELVFAVEHLELPCLRSLNELNHYVRELPENWFKYINYGATDSDASHICLQLMEQLSTTCMTVVARHMNISVRTLRRQLSAESISFQKLKSLYLRDKAIDLLANKTITIERIATHLGYTEASAFTRAFKQWTGNTPRGYRDIVCQ